MSGQPETPTCDNIPTSLCHPSQGLLAGHLPHPDGDSVCSDAFPEKPVPHKEKGTDVAHVTEKGGRAPALGLLHPYPTPRTPQLPPLCLVTRILHTWSWCLWPWGHPSEEGATAPPEAASVLQAFLASGVFSRIGRREKNQEKEDRWRKRIAVTDFRVRTASTVEQCFETH